MSTGKRYDNDYKVQAVKLAMEIGQTKAAKELGLSKSAIGTWVRNARTGKLDMGDDAITFTKPLSASEKLAILERENKALEKENRELREMNEFLEEASAFFAASRQKYAKKKDGDIPSITTIYRILTKMGIIHKAKKKPTGITKADKKARKSDDLLRRNFLTDSPFTKCITDMTEIPVKGGKMYVSAIFDCFHLEVLGLAMDTNMRTELCIKTLRDAHNKHPELCGAIIHSDHGSQYTSKDYRAAMKQHSFIQSMNSDGGRCHDNARCESMWARMKEELLYGRCDTTKMTVTEVKSLIWRYYESYWNNRRICSAIGGMPPKVKLDRYYDSLQAVA